MKLHFWKVPTKFKKQTKKTHIHSEVEIHRFSTLGITNLMDIFIHCVWHVKVNHQSDVD